ncbi:MAG: enoyl-CoA hydratase/isomerase family protein [Polynucleobacter sp.]|nr:MAG: enoyl-CoA hydratase/isomerase family protein [Polynucleobacter sp.]
MTAPTLKLTHPTATIQLNNPESANRLTVDDLEVLMNLINQINENEAITILVLKSTGKYFCSGFDISSLDQDPKEKSLLFEDVVNAVEDCRPITIASLQGGVYGGATDLALACDFRIGCEATEMFMPAAKLGIHFYQRGLERYVSRLGIDVAKRLLLKAEKIDSREMKSIGFLTELVENHDLNNATQNLIDLIQPMAPLSLLGMKKHLNKIARNQLDLTQLNSDIAKAQNSEDLKEGRNAWLEKRPAQFKGF